jgi:hypothetical protein
MPDKVRTIEKLLVEIFRRHGYAVDDDGNGDLCLIEDDYDEDDELVQTIGMNITELAKDLADERVFTSHKKENAPLATGRLKRWQLDG